LIPPAETGLAPPDKIWFNAVGGRMLKRMTRFQKIGKLEIGILKELLERNTVLDPRVVIGPEIGEDAAVIDPGRKTDRYWVVTSDPITFATEEIGYYGVVVNLNDIATMGAIPKWFSATLLFPEGSDLKDIERVFRQIRDACHRFKISLVGGHTEITPGIKKMILSGHMIGEVKKDKLVTTGGARPGDLLLLVKGVCIEGTSIMAREKEAVLLKRGISSSVIRKAKRFIFDPGIEVLRPSRIACGVSSVHAMHDPTEGGLINGMIEMAWASDTEIEVDLEKVLIYKESRILCREFGMDPLGTIASGALLLAVPPSDLLPLQKVFRKNSIPLGVIGKAKKGPARVLRVDRKGRKELEPLPRDEILKTYSGFFTPIPRRAGQVRFPSPSS
jgi:hydrogenase maturation factor